MAQLACVAADKSVGSLDKTDTQRAVGHFFSDVLFGMNPHHTNIEVSASHRSQNMSVWLILDSIYIFIYLAL